MLKLHLTYHILYIRVDNISIQKIRSNIFKIHNIAIGNVNFVLFKIKFN